MSDFDGIIRALRQLSWLGIDNRPKAWAFVTVLALFGAALLFYEMRITWSEVAAHLKGNDAALNHLTARLADSSKTQLPTIVFLGGSATREFTGIDGYVSAEVSKKCGRPVNFINAGSSSQRLAESWAILDALRPGHLQMVVLGFNYYRLTTAKPWFEKEIGHAFIAPVPPSRALQWEYVREFHQIPSPRLWGDFGAMKTLGGIRALRLNRADHQEDDPARPFFGVANYYRGPAENDLLKASRRAEFTGIRAPVYLESYRQTAELWLDFQRYAQGLGIKVVYLVLPSDPVMKPVAKLMDASFDEALTRFREGGATVVDWRTVAGLSANDFFDQQHLLESGRRKVAAPFSDLMAEQLAVCH